jgi:hypothetical protein
VKGSREIAGLARWIFELHIVLDIGIHRLWLRYDKMADFDDRAKEHVLSVTFDGCLVP